MGKPDYEELERRVNELEHQAHKWKEVEAANRDKEDKYKSMFELSPLGIITANLVGNITSCNKAFLKLTGFTKDKIIDKHFTKLPTIMNQDLKFYSKIFCSLISGNKVDSLEFKWNHADGSERLGIAYCSALRKGGKITGFQAILQDITDNRKAEEEKLTLEEQLYQAQKMESIGRFAGGIAHDFNNILTVIMGYAELLKMQYPDIFSSEGEAVNVILKGAERASDLTKQLLGFARGDKNNPVPVKIDKVIKDTVSISERIFEKKITVRYDFEKKINTIEADENQLNQVLTNLIINAKDAMPNGGELSF